MPVNLTKFLNNMRISPMMARGGIFSTYTRNEEELIKKTEPLIERLVSNKEKAKQFISILYNPNFYSNGKISDASRANIEKLDPELIPLLNYTRTEIMRRLGISNNIIKKMRNNGTTY